MQDKNWDDLRIILAISRAGSFAHAAEVLRIDETTVSRRLAKIENRLSCKLFERTNGRLYPTDACETIIGAADQIETLVTASEAATTGADSIASGLVRITAVPLIMNQILTHTCGSFVQRHPDIELSLIAEPSNASLFNRDADIAIRLARPETDANAIARKLGDLTYGVFTASFIDPETVPWISYDQAMQSLPQAKWIRDHAISDGAVNIQISVRDAETLMQTIISGAGKSLLPISIGRQINGLRFCPHPGPSLTREVWVLAHQDIRHLQRMRVTVDWVVETMTAYLD